MANPRLWGSAADDVADPQDPYSISKHEAEEGLRRLATESGMEVVIIRPPLVYGPGVKANFQKSRGRGIGPARYGAAAVRLSAGGYYQDADAAGLDAAHQCG